MMQSAISNQIPARTAAVRVLVQDEGDPRNSRHSVSPVYGNMVRSYVELYPDYAAEILEHCQSYVSQPVDFIDAELAPFCAADRLLDDDLAGSAHR
jgi:hypothetical protein